MVLCQAEDGIRDLVRSRGLGDVYKRQEYGIAYLYGKNLRQRARALIDIAHPDHREELEKKAWERFKRCLLYTSDAADERSSVDLGGRRIIKKKKNTQFSGAWLERNR